MHLYLVRHAHAVEAAVDARRPLSGHGREQAHALGGFARRTETPPPREVWHSELARSRETARLLVAAAGWTAPLRCVDDLHGDADPKAIARRLPSVAAWPVAIVGHDPHLSALASLLVAEVTEPARFVLEKGSMLALTREGGVWAVRWLVSPSTLR